MQKIVQLIDEINRVHLEFSTEYFENHESANLKQTIKHIKPKLIYNYRLNLHESINDYLYDSKEIISYLYRVKTAESIADKLKRFENQPIPVNAYMNDIFGCRAIVDRAVIEELLEKLDELKDEHQLQNYVIHPKSDNEEYRAIHLYFKNQNNNYYPWELQIWDRSDAENNVKNHRLYKRNFVDAD